MSTAFIIRVLTWVYCLSWSFDYRATERGGSPLQFAFFGLAIVCAVAAALLTGRRLFVRPVGWLILLWGTYLGSTAVVAALNGVPWGHYGRNMAAPLLVETGLIMVCAAVAHGLTIKDILVPTIIAACLNSLWKMTYALVISEQSLELVRIEMLSSGQPFLVAWMMLALALRPRFPWMPVLAGSLAVLAYILSVTRSFAFIVMAAVLCAGVAAWQARRLKLLPAAFASRKVRHAAMAVGLIAAAVVMAAVISPTVYDRWFSRLLEGGGGGGVQAETDPSLLTRQAELKTFLTMMNAEPLSWFYGCGVGRTYYWDESFMQELSLTYYIPDFRQEVADVWYPGHSIWTYALFSGGVAGLLFHIALFAGATGLAWRAARQLKSVPEFGAVHAFIPLAGLLACLSLSLTFNVFQERNGGMVLGLLCGLPQFLFSAAWSARRARLWHRLAAPVPADFRGRSLHF